MRHVQLGVILGLAVLSADAFAQQTLIGVSGQILRYHGDTIWIEHDTTVMRTIYRGDTAIVTNYVNDRVRVEAVYVVRGDSVYAVRSRDSLGVEHPASATARGLPLLVVTMARQSLDREIRFRDMQQELGRAGVPTPGTPPISPPTAQSYDVASDLRLVQLRDTVWRIRGCTGAARSDTTVFLLFGRDSVERLSAPRRMFGQAMALALVGQMQAASLRRDLARFQSPLPPDLPRAPDPCRRGQ